VHWQQLALAKRRPATARTEPVAALLRQPSALAELKLTGAAEPQLPASQHSRSAVLPVEL
jgi:hypothetical protein